MESVLQTLMYSAFAAGGAYAAVRVELRFVWREFAKFEKRLDRLEAMKCHE